LNKQIGGITVINPVDFVRRLGGIAMNTDVVIRSTGMGALIEKLGLIEAEKFIMLIQNDTIDYTKWRENLFDGMTLEELSQKAMEYRQSRRQVTRRTPR
jgi:hypothetical protein